MKKIKKGKIILLVILILAGFLRFWQLGQVPISSDWDEASLGWNAYSILETGRDEYGQRLPLILRSFDDYKPALYVYFVIPAIKLFGLNTFAVRFPAAFFGTIAVFLTYLLVKELFGKQKDGGEKIALLVSFLLAISPWHLQFSRIAFESNIGVFFNILWVFLLLNGLKKPWLLSLSALVAGLNIYIYQAEKVFTPLLVLLVGLIWREKLLKLPRKYLVAAVLVGLMTVLPFGYLAKTTPEIFLRAKGTSFAADQTPFLSRTANKLAEDHKNNDFLGLIIDNRRVTYAVSFINGYISHFSPNWFINGDDARHHAPGMGLLYLVELPFFLWGIYALVFGKYSKKTKWLILGWFLLAPIPAAFSSGTPHAVRTLRFLPMVQIFSGLGLIGFYQWLKTKKLVLKGLALSLGLIFFIFNFGYYFNQYFVQQNYFNSQFWQYGYNEAVESLNNLGDNYQKIVVSNQQPLDQSYMFFLFYLQYDPKTYLQEGGTASGGFAEDRNAFGKYVFRSIDWPNEKEGRETLYIGRASDFPGNESVIKTIYFLDGEPVMKLVEGR